MAHLYDRPKGSGNWWVKFYPVRGAKAEYRPLGKIAKREAEEIAASIARDLALGKVARLVPGLLTLEEVLARFLRDKHEHTEKATWTTYEKHIRAIRAGMDCNQRVGDVRPEDVREYMRARRQRVGPRTVNHERTTLSQVYNWAIREDIAERNPVLATKPYALGEEPERAAPEEVVRDCIAALREAATTLRPPDAWLCEVTADALHVLWWTSWRMGELCRLRPEDVDAKAWTAVLRAAWNKGGKRTVPIPVEVRETIERRLALGKSYVFSAYEGGHGYSAIYRFRTYWLETHPEHKRANFHGLRHAYARALRRSGVDRTTRRGLTRHATEEMQEHYEVDDLDDLRAAQARLAAWRRQSTPRRRKAP